MAGSKHPTRPEQPHPRTPVWVAAWLYETAMGAATGEVRVRDLQVTDAFTLLDVASLTWFPGAHRPRVGYGRRTVEVPGGSGPSTVLSALLQQVLEPPGQDRTRGGAVVPPAGVEGQVVSGIREHLLPGRSVLVVVSTDIDFEVVGPLLQRGLSRRGVRLVAAPLDLDGLGGLQLAPGRSTARSHAPS